MKKSFQFGVQLKKIKKNKKKINGKSTRKRLVPLSNMPPTN